MVAPGAVQVGQPPLEGYQYGPMVGEYYPGHLVIADILPAPIASDGLSDLGRSFFAWLHGLLDFRPAS